MKVEFVRTPEFDESISELKNMFTYLSKPKNLLCVLFNAGLWFTFYLMMLVIADTWR